ncbi:MAG: hypothetical protein ACO1SV_25675 [Fimbriimonas sp.]
MITQCALVAATLLTPQRAPDPDDARLLVTRANPVAREIWLYTSLKLPRRILELPLQERAEHSPMTRIACRPDGNAFLIALDYRADFVRQFIEIGEFDLRGRRLRRFRRKLDGDAGFGYDGQGVPYLGQLLDDGSATVVPFDAKRPPQVESAAHLARMETRRFDPSWVTMTPWSLPDGGADVYVTGVPKPLMKVERDQITDLRSGAIFKRPSHVTQWWRAVVFGTSWLAIGQDASAYAPSRSVGGYAIYSPGIRGVSVFDRAAFAVPLLTDPKRFVPLHLGVFSVHIGEDGQTCSSN